MTYYAYLFEAHTIQSYIFNSGKLAEMVGASEILEYLISEGGPLDTVLESMEIAKDDQLQFSLRGGGGFYVFVPNQEDAQLLQQAWSLITNAVAPGLEYSHCIATDISMRTTIKKGTHQLRQQRNQPQAVFPEIGPWIRRSPRTGTAAVENHYEAGEKKVWIDKASKIKWQDNYRLGKTLTAKFLTEQQIQDYEFPRNLEYDEGQFPYQNDNHIIGIIHADGNGLGEILIGLSNELKDSEQYASVFFELSKKIDSATQKAAKQALQPILDAAKEEADKRNHRKMLIPARPLVLGGDDLTIIVRGDLALDYADKFLQCFEEQTKVALKKLHNQYPNIIPEQMTACAGITLLNSSKPFSMGYGLAESLCAAAKDTSRKLKKQTKSKIIPASLCFHHVTSSLIEEYNLLLSRELTAHIDNTHYQLTLGAYGTGGFSEGLPPFAELRKLKNIFSQEETAQGSTRQLLTMLHHDIKETKQIWYRWRKAMDNNMLKTEKDNHLVEFDNAKSNLLNQPQNNDDLPFVETVINTNENGYKTFLGDLSSWLAVTGGAE